VKLPPGQSETRKFPVVGERAPSADALDLESWRLEVGGLVAHPLELTYGEVMALPQSERVVDVHCVTGWSQEAMRFGGFPLRLLLDRARPLPEASYVRFEAYSDRGHDTSLPLDLAREDTWIVHSRDGEPLTPEHGYPLRTVTPSRYFYKSLKWLHRIELLAEDRLGYWERESSYHPRGDPWAGDERFVTGSLRPGELERFRRAERFDRHRGPKKVKLGLGLRGWSPRSRDLHDLHLKNCDLRGADLREAELRNANLSLSDLRGADLRGADLRGADVEGVDFAGADLRRADLTGAALSAARFFAEGEEDSGARVEGLRYEGASGLLEAQEAYLERRVG